jgi:hypothetical protein
MSLPVKVGHSPGPSTRAAAARQATLLARPQAAVSLANDYLEDLTGELIHARCLGVDENSRTLVRAGDAGAPEAAPKLKTPPCQSAPG